MMVSAINLIPLVLFIGVPLVCTSIIARRMSRGPIVVALPWALLAVFSLGLSAMFGFQRADGSNVVLTMNSVAMGGFGALVVSLIVLAVVGVKRDRLAPAEAF
jgi:hypothetical protein